MTAKSSSNGAMLLVLKRIGSCMKPKKLLRLRSIIHMLIILILVYLCYILGLFTHLLEKDLREFRYPLKIDVRVALQTLYKDINTAKYLQINTLNYTYLHRAKQMCKPYPYRDENTFAKPYLVILVKSKLTHFEHRKAIRNTWGRFDQLRLIRTVFLIGIL